MQQTDDIVSSWLSGSDSMENPAGPLYIEGTAGTEAALTDPNIAKNPLCSIITDTTIRC
jgi:hypothetical protein